MNEALMERIFKALDDDYVANNDPQLLVDIEAALDSNTAKRPLTDAEIEEHNLNFFTPAKVSFREGVHFAEKYHGVR